MAWQRECWQGADLAVPLLGCPDLGLFTVSPILTDSVEYCLPHRVVVCVNWDTLWKVLRAFRGIYTSIICCCFVEPGIIMRHCFVLSEKRIPSSIWDLAPCLLFQPHSSLGLSFLHRLWRPCELLHFVSRLGLCFSPCRLSWPLVHPWTLSSATQ